MKTILKKTSLVFASLIFSFILIELGMRLYGFTYPAWEIRDREVGYIGLPHAEGWWTAEGRGFVRYNSHGFRDIERTFDKTAKSIRIAVIGDSFTQAREVSFDSIFLTRAERNLKSCKARGERQVDILNFGVGGFNTAAQLQLWRSRVKKFDPDWVLVAFYVGNDIEYNHPELDYYRDSPGTGLPLFKFVDDRLEVDFSFRDKPLFRRRLNSRLHAFGLYLINRSTTLQFLNFARHNYKTWLRIGGNGGARNVTPEEKENGANPKSRDRINKVLFQPSDRLWTEAWALTEAGLEVLAGEVSDAGAKIGLVLIPDPAQIDKSDSQYPQKRLNNWSRLHSIDALDLLPPLRKAYQATREHPFGFANAVVGDGHWNEVGHKISGNALSKWICKSLSADN